MKEYDLKIDYLLFAFAMLLIALVGKLIGGSVLLELVIPILIAVFAFRQSMIAAVFYTILSATIFLSFNNGIWILVLTIFGAMGITLGRCLKLPVRHEKTLIKVVIAAAFGLLVWMILLQNIIGGVNFSELINKSVENSNFTNDVMIAMQQSLGEGESVDWQAFETEIKTFIKLTAPSLTLIALFFYSLFVHWLTVFVLRATQHRVLKLPKLSRVKLPGNAIHGTTIVVILALLIYLISPVYGNPIVVNTLYVVLFMFWIQGVAVIATIAERVKAGPLLTAVIILGSILILRSLFLGAAGWIDLTFNIRKKIRRGIKGEQKK